MYDALVSVKANPYQDYETFLSEVKALAANELREFCDEMKTLDRDNNYDDHPALYLKNCPIDKEMPIFDHEDPVASKYELKKIFATEAFLCLYAEAVGTIPLGYATINGGDIFHDMYLKTALRDTHSQKSMRSIGFHNDLPNNRARPDWVNIVCHRNHPANKVSTTFIRNRDIIDYLDDETLRVLAEPIFYTEHEVIAVHGGKDKAGVEVKPIYYPGSDITFVYFEQRTTSNEERGLKAIARMDEALHAMKERIYLQPGDFVAINNNACIHGREVVDIQDMEAHKKRWLMKTWNVNTIDGIADLLVPERFHVVNE